MVGECKPAEHHVGDQVRDVLRFGAAGGVQPLVRPRGDRVDPMHGERVDVVAERALLHAGVHDRRHLLEQRLALAPHRVEATVLDVAPLLVIDGDVRAAAHGGVDDRADHRAQLVLRPLARLDDPAQLGGQVIEQLAVDDANELVLAVEVVVEGALRDVRLVDDGLHRRGVEAVDLEEGERAVQDGLARGIRRVGPPSLRGGREAHI